MKKLKIDEVMVEMVAETGEEGTVDSVEVVDVVMIDLIKTINEIMMIREVVAVVVIERRKINHPKPLAEKKNLFIIMEMLRNLSKIPMTKIKKWM